MPSKWPRVKHNSVDWYEKAKQKNKKLGILTPNTQIETLRVSQEKMHKMDRTEIKTTSEIVLNKKDFEEILSEVADLVPNIFAVADKILPLTALEGTEVYNHTIDMVNNIKSLIECLNGISNETGIPGLMNKILQRVPVDDPSER